MGERGGELREEVGLGGSSSREKDVESIEEVGAEEGGGTGIWRVLKPSVEDWERGLGLVLSTAAVLGGILKVLALFWGALISNSPGIIRGVLKSDPLEL